MRRSSLAMLLVVAATLGAWSATALGQAGPPTVPTVSVPLPTVSVPLPPVPPPTLPTPPAPPVTVTVPPAPVTVPSVAVPRAPAPPSLPGAATGTVSSAGGAVGSAASAPAGSAATTALGSPVLGFAGQSGSSSSSGGSSAASDDGNTAEQQSLARRRDTAAERVRGTRNLRPVPARFENRGPNRRSTMLVFWLERPGRVVFTVLDASNGCRVLGSFAYRGRAGVNRVRYRGRVNGKPLGPGRYTLVPRVYRGSSVTQLERVTIQVLRPGAKVPLWRRSALVPAECRGNSLAGVYDSASYGSRFGGSQSALARNGGSSSSAGAASSGARERSGDVKGAEATNPNGSAGDDDPQPIDEDPDDNEGGEGLALPTPFGDDTGEGPPPLVAAAVLTGLGLAIMMLFVLLVRYVRGSWNP